MCLLISVIIKTTGWFSTWYLFDYLIIVLPILGFTCWLFYKPFQKMIQGIVVLIFAQFLYLFGIFGNKTWIIASVVLLIIASVVSVAAWVFIIRMYKKKKNIQSSEE